MSCFSLLLTVKSSLSARNISKLQLLDWLVDWWIISPWQLHGEVAAVNWIHWLLLIGWYFPKCSRMKIKISNESRPIETFTCFLLEFWKYSILGCETMWFNTGTHCSILNWWQVLRNFQVGLLGEHGFLTISFRADCWSFAQVGGGFETINLLFQNFRSDLWCLQCLYAVHYFTTYAKISKMFSNWMQLLLHSTEIDVRFFHKEIGGAQFKYKRFEYLEVGSNLIFFEGFLRLTNYCK